MKPLEDLIVQAQSCTLCAAHLPLGPRPVFRISATARLLIIGQSPGTKIAWAERRGISIQYIQPRQASAKCALQSLHAAIIDKSRACLPNNNTVACESGNALIAQRRPIDDSD